ncbi:MAG: thioredoxin family protein [Bacteroidales bacterium]|nr:thioredoxin family protein [Bacteroidales bacterium]
MKTSLWFTILAILFSLSLHAQNINKKITDSELDQEILIGYCNRAALQEGEFGEYYLQEYENYDADKQFIEKIYNVEGSVDIVLVLGTWCQDSQEQVPRFYRIMDDAKVPDDVIAVICVDGNKTGGELSIEHLGIELVPTFIVYRGGEEIGRIIETPEASLEEDFWNIIK